MRVLIADDQRSVGTSLAELVRSCNHHIVAVVGSGVEAIHAYSLHRPDVVLMDYWMPKLNGATACRNIVAKDPMARVILVSAWSPANGILGDSAHSCFCQSRSISTISPTHWTMSRTLCRCRLLQSKIERA